MPIPETQLDTWAKVGSQTQSKDTYATIRNALDIATAPYNGDIEIFLQGSYGNDTNVYGKESDVDIVMRSDRAYFRDLSGLTPAEKASYAAGNGGTADYPFSTFRADVIKILKAKFGTDVDTTNKKAIKIAANGARRSADVLVCQDHRRYLRYTGRTDDYVNGIGFNTTDGTLIENYPKFHSASLTAKHQATNQWLKPTIRIFKNMRNNLIANNKVKNGVAPSYYVEGLLSNAPDTTFGNNYSTTVFNSLKWLQTVDENSLSCANGMSGLLGDNSPTKWDTADFRTFKNGVINLWNDWT
jgi:hypothetical protein